MKTLFLFLLLVASTRAAEIFLVNASGAPLHVGTSSTSYPDLFSGAVVTDSSVCEIIQDNGFVHAFNVIDGTQVTVNSGDRIQVVTPTSAYLGTFAKGFSLGMIAELFGMMLLMSRKMSRQTGLES